MTAIDQATIPRVQAWKGQATTKCVHHSSRASDVRLLAAAFRTKESSIRGRAEKAATT